MKSASNGNIQMRHDLIADGALDAMTIYLDRDGEQTINPQRAAQALRLCNSWEKIVKARSVLEGRGDDRLRLQLDPAQVLLAAEALGVGGRRGVGSS